jgi:hypothetical protein
MYLSKYVIGKDSKKHRVLQVRVFLSIHAGCEASARSENCAWSTLEKLQKYNTGRIRCFWFFSLVHPKIEAPWIQPPLPYVWWMFTFAPGCIGIGRSPFEMGTGFCAIGVANATGSRYHFVCWNEVPVVSGFFLSGRRFMLFCQKVRVCCPLRLSKRPHLDLASESRCVCQICNSEFHDVVQH